MQDVAGRVFIGWGCSHGRCRGLLVLLWCGWPLLCCEGWGTWGSHWGWACVQACCKRQQHSVDVLLFCVLAQLTVAGPSAVHVFGSLTWWSGRGSRGSQSERRRAWRGPRQGAWCLLLLCCNGREDLRKGKAEAALVTRDADKPAWIASGKHTSPAHTCAGDWYCAQSPAPRSFCAEGSGAAVRSALCIANRRSLICAGSSGSPGGPASDPSFCACARLRATTHAGLPP